MKDRKKYFEKRKKIYWKKNTHLDMKRSSTEKFAGNWEYVE